MEKFLNAVAHLTDMFKWCVLKCSLINTHLFDKWHVMTYCCCDVMPWCKSEHLFVVKSTVNLGVPALKMYVFRIFVQCFCCCHVMQSSDNLVRIFVQLFYLKPLLWTIFNESKCQPVISYWLCYVFEVFEEIKGQFFWQESPLLVALIEGSSVLKLN